MSEWGNCVRCGLEDKDGVFQELIGQSTPDNPDGGTGDPICPKCIERDRSNPLELVTVVLANLLVESIASLDISPDAIVIGPSCNGFIQHAGKLPNLNARQMSDLAWGLQGIADEFDAVLKMLYNQKSTHLDEWQTECLKHKQALDENREHAEYAERQANGECTCDLLSPFGHVTCAYCNNWAPSDDDEDFATLAEELGI